MLAVALVLVAAYVSAGRQFMPAVSGYVSFFEEQVFERSGIPISVESLVGDFDGFNPVLHVNGMALLLADDEVATEEAALFLQSATIIVDIPQSIWQRRLVLEDFVVESLEINLDQSESGAWQLRGFADNNDEAVDFDSLYQSLQQFSQLSLRGVVIKLHNFEGETLSLENGLATIANRDDKLYLHANLTLEESSEQMALSFEVSGDELVDMQGQLHVDLPPSDYSELFTRQTLADLSLKDLFGGGSFWFSFAEGKLNEFVSQLELDAVTLHSSTSDPLSLSNLSGAASLRRQATNDGWELALSNMGLSWQQMQWSPFNIFISFIPQESVALWADNIDVSLIAQFVESSGLLDETAQQQLAQYAPRGSLDNFSFSGPLEEDSEQHLLIKTNVNNVEVGSVRGSPSMWGLDGYAEFDFDPVTQQGRGFADIESDRFRMNIPAVFTSIWDHNYVNGRIGFSLDLSEGMHLRVKSNTIVAETDIIEGRVQFTSIVNRPRDGEPRADLDLRVGALRLDAAGRAAYLPDAPQVDESLANTMEWLNAAIQGGTLVNSGVVYRGSTLSNAASAAKTFQGFFLLEDGELNFSDEWPDLNEVKAFVIADDNNVDIKAQHATSLDVVAKSVRGLIRENAEGENWLSIQGAAEGATANGLDYLQNAAVGEGLKTALANWQAQGNFSADIAVEVPLNSSQQQTAVRLDMNLEKNSLFIPDYAIQIDELTGPILFDTRTGIEDSELSGQLFGQNAEIHLGSNAEEGVLESIEVRAAGLVAPEALIAWPMQSQFVRGILKNMEGQFAYQAELSIDQTGTSDVSNRLLIDSTLQGASLAVPHPFTKPVEVELPLKIEIAFSDDQEMIAGSLGSNLSFNLELEQGEILDGLVFVGEDQESFESLQDNASEGLVVIGDVDQFPLQEWTDFLADFNGDESVSEDMGSSIEFVDLQIERFQLYGEELDDVNMRISPVLEQESWGITLQSNAIAGEVKLPFDSEGYLDVDLQYLRLPGDESELVEVVQEEGIALLPPEEEEEEDPIDVLADIDPRELSRMHFSTKEFLIGERPYGSWSFTLNPNSEGAEIDEIAIDFRGLRLGLDAEAEEPPLIPHFNWRYDGTVHTSELSGVLIADDMADVLRANGYAASLESDSAEFVVDLSWPGSPAFFMAENLSGDLAINIEDGRFLRRSGAAGALKLISILNFDAIMRRLRFSDDLLRSGLAYDEITGKLSMVDGQVHIEDRLVISGPSSLYQITGDLNLKDESIVGEMYLTLPVSNNIPWLGLLTANIPLAVGAYLFDRVFGDQVDSLTSAVYTLEGPWEGLEPKFKQAFGSPDTPAEAVQ